MHVQVVTYRIADISESEFIAANREFAEMMAAVPGLIAKIWLQGDGADSFGGLYLWQDRRRTRTSWPESCGQKRSTTTRSWISPPATTRSWQS